MWYSWRMARALETLWKCTQMGEIKAVHWLLWTDFPDQLYVMMVSNAMSKWEITWLQMTRQSKFPQRMTAALKNLGRMEDIPRGSGDRLESGGSITFYANSTKNRPMWYCWPIIWICTKLWDPKMQANERPQCKRSMIYSWRTIHENWASF